MAAMTAICAPISGRLVGSRGTRPSLLVAGVAMTAGTLLLTTVSLDSGRWLLFSAYLLFGVGFGTVNAPITNTAVSGMPLAQAGVAAAVASTSRQVGTALGVAVVGTAYTSRLADGPLPAAHLGWWIVAGCTLVVLLIGLLTSGRWAMASAARTADRLAGTEPLAGAGGAGGGPMAPRVALKTER